MAPGLIPAWGQIDMDLPTVVPKSDSVQSCLRPTCSFHASAGLLSESMHSSSHFHTHTSLHNTLSPFAWPASPHSLSNKCPSPHRVFHCPCFLLLFSTTTDDFSVPYIPDFINPTQFSVSSSVSPRQLALSHYLYPLSVSFDSLFSIPL